MTITRALFGLSRQPTRLGHRFMLLILRIIYTEQSLESCYFTSIFERGLKNSRIAVPLKPKASRNRFSKYRSYEKCTACGSLTKKTKVGGFTRVCVT